MNKTKLLEIAHALDLGSIDDEKARTLLLGLLGVSNRMELLKAYDKFAEMEHAWFIGTEEETKGKFLVAFNC
jgi:hypothetical protein